MWGAVGGGGRPLGENWGGGLPKLTAGGAAPRRDARERPNGAGPPGSEPGPLIGAADLSEGIFVSPK